MGIYPVQGESCYCESEEEGGFTQWYTVTAPSGLILRAGPDRNTAKLDAIPFGEEVLSCSSTAVRETIEGKTDSWLKVTWADKTGYLFGGFLKETWHRKIQMLIPDSGINSMWEIQELDSSLAWQALADLDTSARNRRRNSPILSALELQIEGKIDTESGYGQDLWRNNAVLNLPEAPFAGDLDGDNELDLILGTQGCSFVKFQLFLSSKKLPGFLMRYVAVWFDIDC